MQAGLTSRQVVSDNGARALRSSSVKVSLYAAIGLSVPFPALANLGIRLAGLYPHERNT